MKGKMNAWIDPEGNFIPVGYMQHNEWANEYFREKYGLIEGIEKVEEICGSMYSSYPYTALHKLGWIRLLSWTDDKPKLLGECESNEYLRDTRDPSMTEAQKKTTIRWAQINKVNYKDLFTP